MSMDLIIIVMKIGGLAITAILGVVALLVENHKTLEIPRTIILLNQPETVKKRVLTIGGKCTFAGIIFGAILGTAGFCADFANQHRKEQEAEKKSDEAKINFEAETNALWKLQQKDDSLWQIFSTHPSPSPPQRTANTCCPRNRSR